MISAESQNMASTQIRKPCIDAKLIFQLFCIKHRAGRFFVTVTIIYVHTVSLGERIQVEYCGSFHFKDTCILSGYVNLSSRMMYSSMNHVILLIKYWYNTFPQLWLKFHKHWEFLDQAILKMLFVCLWLYHNWVIGQII